MRIAFARLLLASPQYAILDEATSALDLNNEERLYQQLHQANITFISVGHRSSLVKYHHMKGASGLTAHKSLIKVCNF